jgi:dihydropteroate synthase
MVRALSTGVPVLPEAQAAAQRSARYHVRVLEARELPAIARELLLTGCEPEGVGIMTPIGRALLIRLDHVSLKAAPLLKQELLAAGGDSAHARGIADHSVSESSVVLLTTSAELRGIVEKLERQPFRLREIGEAISEAVARYSRPRPESVPGLHRRIPLGPVTRVMGVLNVTPDSFSDGGQFLEPERAVERARAIEAEGADLLDVGAESTRPGAAELSEDAEWARLEPVLRRLVDSTRLPISVDTRHAPVARRALEAGADLVNDVSGLRDPAMRALLARTGAPAIVMHMRGTPETMQQDLRYGDVRGEVFGALAEVTAQAIADGVDPERILIDPGFGFGKSAEQNLELLAHLGEFRALGYPIVVGASRKSFLGRVLDEENPDGRLEAGLAAAALAAEHGAAYVRTHDVRATVRALRLVAAVTAEALPK